MKFLRILSRTIYNTYVKVFPVGVILAIHIYGFTIIALQALGDKVDTFKHFGSAAYAIFSFAVTGGAFFAFEELILDFDIAYEAKMKKGSWVSVYFVILYLDIILIMLNLLTAQVAQPLIILFQDSEFKQLFTQKENQSVSSLSPIN